MLNKEICQKCRTEIKRNKEYCFLNEWNKKDEQNWKNGIVICPYINSGHSHSFLFIECSPPKECLYITEHIVASEEEFESREGKYEKFFDENFFIGDENV